MAGCYTPVGQTRNPAEWPYTVRLMVCSVPVPMYATNVADADYLERFGTTLSVVMDFRDVSPGDLADAIGSSRDTIYRWQSGQHAPTTDLMVRLAAELDAPGDLFLRPLASRGQVFGVMGAWDELRARQSDERPYPWLP
jgi:transcriptional regulator with XRE-family HTH domain